jgi:DNA polymerase III delta prime subunit
VPATIRSRSQWHAFRPISVKDISVRLRQIAEREGLKLPTAVADLLAVHGRGSLRDSIGLFEQTVSGGEPSLKRVSHLLGLTEAETIQRLARHLQAGDWQRLRDELQAAETAAVSAKALAQQLIDELGRQPPTTANLNLIERLIDVSASLEPWLMLHVVLLREALNRQPARPADGEPESTPAETKPSSDLKPAQWQAVLDEIKSRNHSLYAILRLARPKLVGEENSSSVLALTSISSA